MVAVGLSVAALFAHAAHAERARATRLVSPLYAADVLGGAVAAVLVPLVLVPVLGLAQTARAAGLLALCCLALV
jgi:predicted membrane-bound spermidine synthase